LKRIPEQLKRIGIVTIIIVGGVLLARALVPASLVDRRIHKASTVEREIAKPVQFAGTATCVECHEDQNAKKKTGYHRNLACETCHGPAAKHADDPTSVKPFAPRDRKFCPLCHAYDASRPTGFPQINPTAHNPLKPCIACHNAHDPTPPRVPQECSACHAEIARTKAVSSHALLSCTTCHTAPARHRQYPRSVSPTKPETREFCGTCHDKATRPDKKVLPAFERAPKVDMTNHGGRYLCWQCHYPHMPGGEA
jgi:hypothetical protein